MKLSGRSLATAGKEVQHTVNSTTVSALKTCNKVYVAIKFPFSSVDDDVCACTPLLAMTLNARMTLDGSC